MYPYATKHMVPNLAFAVMGEAHKLVTEQLPELKQDFASFTSCDFKVGFDEALCIVVVQFKDSGIPSGGRMENDEFQKFKSKVGTARRYPDLAEVSELSEYFGWDRLLLAGDVIDEVTDWHLLAGDVVSWMNSVGLPRAALVNERRVRMAIPTPPRFSPTILTHALWVLECEPNMWQGTAFDLEGYGTITNEHVIAGSTSITAFRPDAPSKTYNVNVVKSNSVLDLALLKVVDAPQTTGLVAARTELDLMGHVAVCGFPNYRLGDTGIISPGIVVGTRMVSGVRRLLTNAGIVRGMSGGPAVIDETEVCGICVTGGDLMQSSRETEDQAIIPVSALDILKSS